MGEEEAVRADHNAGGGLQVLGSAPRQPRSASSQRPMDYSGLQQQQQQQQQQLPQHASSSSPARGWSTQLLTPAGQSSLASPVSPFFFPPQPPPPPGLGQANQPRAGLSLNMGSLGVTPPSTHSPIAHPNPQTQQGPFHDQTAHPQHAHLQSIPPHAHAHAHAHSRSSGSTLSVSPITPVSPQNLSSAHLSSQFNFSLDDVPGGGLMPTPEPVVDKRRPSTGSRSNPSTELVVQKSVPRKRSLTNAHPASQTSPQTVHAHSQSHSYAPSPASFPHGLQHPIITTTPSSQPPTSPASPSSSHASHSQSYSVQLSQSQSQQSLSQSSSQYPSQSHSQMDFGTNPSYDDMDGAAQFGLMPDDVSDDDYASSFGCGTGEFPFPEATALAAVTNASL